MNPLDLFMPQDRLVRVRASDLERLCRIEQSAMNLHSIILDLHGKPGQEKMLSIKPGNVYAAALFSSALREMTQSLSRNA